MTDQPEPQTENNQDASLEKEIADALGDQSIEQLIEAESVNAAKFAQPAAPAPPSDPLSPDAEPEAERDNNAITTRVGTVRAIRGDDVLVEFSAGKEQGVCSLRQFPKTPRVGDHPEFIVDGFDEAESLLQLRLPGATTKATWDTIQKGMIVEGVVIGMNTGGLELKIAGQRAFMPISQIDTNRVEDLTPFLNHKLRCKVTELNKKKKRVVVSRRAVLDVESEKARAELLSSIEVGAEMDGTVKSIQKFGAFVEILEGVDGLVHVSDMAHTRVNNPNDVVKVGDKVRVRVLKVGDSGKRISLGMKQAMPDPWETVSSKYAVGEKVKGKVVKTTDFGAFIELEPGVEGLVHISQLSVDRVNRVDQVAKVGQEIEALVTEFDIQKHRIGLSIKALTAPEESPADRASRDDIRQYVKKEDQAKAMESLMGKFGDLGGLKGGIG